MHIIQNHTTNHIQSYKLRTIIHIQHIIRNHTKNKHKKTRQTSYNKSLKTIIRNSYGHHITSHIKDIHNKCESCTIIQQRIRTSYTIIQQTLQNHTTSYEDHTTNHRQPCTHIRNHTTAYIES